MKCSAVFPVKYLPLVLFLGIFVACEAVSVDGRYPLELNPLSEEALSERVNEYHNMSNGEVCSGLDEYGYTIGDGCFGTDRPEHSIDSSKAVDIVRSGLTAYSKFTNVHEESDVKIIDARPMNRSENREWRVEIDQQILQGLPVKNSDITVWLTADGIYRIDGYWYPQVLIPDDFEIDKQEALQHIIGHKIHYSDWGGSKTFTVEESDLPPTSAIETVILPFKEENKLQLRVAWKIPVPADFPLWYLYVDVMDKRVLQDKQLIFF